MANSNHPSWIERNFFRVLGVLLVAPWLFVPRPSTTPKPLDQVPAARATTADVSTLEERAYFARTIRSPHVDDELLDGWRRTERGWEHKNSWTAQSPRPYPTPLHRLHPITFACMQLLLCLGGLVLYSRS